MSDNHVIRIDRLTHFYGDRQALHKVSFSVYQGEIFGILGPNGGGKTTLFRILSTLIRPSEGSAQIENYDVLTQPALVRQSLGVVFQSPSLDVKLTVEENLLHQGHLYKLSGTGLRKRCDQLLERFGLAERKNDLVEKLSGGVRRRVELAKGLLHRPKILILDEPSTGLDPGARKELWDYLEELQARDGVTILLTTHLLEEGEKCDRLAILNKGQLIALGSPTELKARIGGDVLMVQSSKPEDLRQQLADHFHLESTLLDGLVRVERDNGHEFVPKIIEAFPGMVESITVGKPTLEDVFIKETGHKFWNGKQSGVV